MAEAFWRKGMLDSLDMTSEKRQLKIDKRRVPVNEQIFHLIIGLGGTGIDALLECKGLINLTCENADSRVKYLGIDTDQKSKNKKSSAVTGEAKIEYADRGGELLLLESDSVTDKLTMSKIEGTLGSEPYYFSWLDEKISPSGGNNGAEHNRQVGRMILYHNYEKIASRIEDAIRSLITCNPAPPVSSKLMVYIVSGISGGTGSGMFLDIGLIVRDILQTKGLGFASRSNTIYGYFFMPDINNGTDQDLNRRNAYAALQELDYLQSLPDIHEKFTIEYPGDKMLTIGDFPVFDFVHMVSGTNLQGILIEEPYRTSMRAIAQNVLCFVANEEGVGDNGGTTFSIDSHYSNINTITSSVINQLTVPHRQHNYLAVGSDEYNIPIDDIMMYVASLFMNDMSKCAEYKDVAEVSCDEINQKYEKKALMDLLLGKLKLKPSVGYSKDDNKEELKTRAMDETKKKFKTTRTRFENNGFFAECGEALNELKKDFDEMLEKIFKDSERGPVFASKLISNSDFGILTKLKNLITELNDEARVEIETDDEWKRNKNNYEKNVTGKIDDVIISQLNNFRKNMDKRATELSVAPILAKVLEDLKDYVQTRNESFYEIGKEVFISYCDVFAKNAAKLENDHAEVSYDDKFEWQRLNVALLKDVIKKMYDEKTEGNEEDLKTGFLAGLYDRLPEWEKNHDMYNPRGYISRFIDEHFGTIAEKTIEDFVKALLKLQASRSGRPEEDIASLVSNSKTGLITNMVNKSEPLYYPSKQLTTQPTQRKVMLISVPDNCLEIYKAISDYCKANQMTNKECILQKSSVKNRIYVQTVACALPLCGYNIVWEAEADYSRLRDNKEGQSANGVHLYRATGPHATEFRNWDKLPTLIPYRQRPIGYSASKVPMLIEEENQRKDALKTFTDGQHYMVSADINGKEHSYTFRLSGIYAAFDKKDGKLWLFESQRLYNMYKRLNDDGRYGDENYNIKKYSLSNLEEGYLSEIIEELENCLTDGFGSILNEWGKEEYATSITEQLIMQGNLPDHKGTDEYLGENYIRHYELVRMVDAEKSLYDTVREFVECAKQKWDEIEKTATIDYNFAKLYAFKKIFSSEDIETGSQCMFLSDDPNGEPIINLKLRNSYDILIPQRLYTVYLKIVGDTTNKYGFLMDRLDILLEEANAELKKAKNDINVCTDIMNEIAKMNIERTYREAVTKKAAGGIIEFYRMLAAQTKKMTDMLNRYKAKLTDDGTGNKREQPVHKETNGTLMGDLF